MSAKEFAAQLKTTIEEIKAKGTAAIYCDNLIAYLDEVVKNPSPVASSAELEKFKADLQVWIEQNKAFMNPIWRCSGLLSNLVKMQYGHLFF